MSARQRTASPTADPVLTLNDEAIAEEVRRMLREDVATSHLTIAVRVNEGVVRLRGVVPRAADAENAEVVAGRVQEARGVVNELLIASEQ